MKKRRVEKHWCVLAALCGLAASSVGICINSAGVFYGPVSADLGILRGSFALHATIASVVTAAAALAVPGFLNARNFKPVLATGVLLAGFSTCAMSCVSALPGFYFLGVLRGMGNAVYGMVVLTILINGWFTDCHGLATSIVLSFGGIAGAVCSPLFTAVIASRGWRAGYWAMGALIIFFCVPAILYPFALAPEEEGLLPYGGAGAKGRERGEKQPFSAARYASFSFAALLLIGILHTAVTCLPQHFPGFAESIGLYARTGAVMLSCCMVGNILSKLLIGILADRWSAMKATIFMIVLHLCSIVMLLLSRKEALLYMGAFLFGTVYSVSAVGLVLITKEYFGVENYSRVYPAVSFAGGVSCAAGLSLVGYLYDFTGSYQLAFVLAVGFHVMDLVLLWGIRRRSEGGKKESPANSRLDKPHSL